AARDKHVQRRELARHGVPVPRFELHGLDEDVTQLAARVHCPCVLKPLRLAASRGVMRADDARGFAAAFARVKGILEQARCERSILVEDFVPGPEVALEGLVIDGRLAVLGLFDKPDPLDGPFFEETIYVTPSRLPAPAQRELARRGEAAAEARAVPLVDDVAITAHPGEALVPWPEGSRYPGFIFARGETPEAVEGALRAAHGRLTFVFQ